MGTQATGVRALFSASEERVERWRELHRAAKSQATGLVGATRTARPNARIAGQAMGRSASRTAATATVPTAKSTRNTRAG